MEIYSYGNVDALHAIFWTVKLIMGGSDYLDIIRTFIIIGFMVAAISGLSGMRIEKSWGWLISLFVMFSVLFIPKTDVIITDKLGSQPPVVVQNVPWSIGFLKMITSTAGHTLTTLSETAAQTIPDPKRNLPAELSYQRHGLMFGNRLVKETLTADIQDPQLKVDLVNFIRNCTIYDLMDGTIDTKTFTTATDVWPLMRNTNPARFTSIKPTAGPPSVVSCTTAYDNLGPRLVVEVPQVMKILGAKLYPTLTPAAAVSQIDSAVLAGYQKTGIANVAAASADLIRQNIMINTFAETGQIHTRRKVG
jgi:conjugal transfer mating pair stabilization protein TraG